MDSSVQAVSDMIGLYALNIAIAIVIFIVGKWVVRKVADAIEKVMTKSSKVDQTLAKFLHDIIYYVLLVVVVLTALKQVGVDTTSFFAILGAAGLAIGLALKDSLGNFASGVMIILLRPFKVGDFVNAGGVSGTVEAITIFHTVLKTGDNQKLIVPNGSIINDTITNVNANPERRVDLIVGIGYDDDIKKTKEILARIIDEDERILKDKDIKIAVSELADSSVNFVVRAWVNTPDYWNVKFDLTEKIKITFDEEGISIPYPQSDVHIHNQN